MTVTQASVLTVLAALSVLVSPGENLIVCLSVCLAFCMYFGFNLLKELDPCALRSRRLKQFKEVILSGKTIQII